MQAAHNRLASTPGSTHQASTHQTAHMSLAGKVLQGTCGWTDASILQSGKFYPSSARSSEQRLAHYCRHFPCVEVDCSCYSIPKPEAVRKWAKHVLPGFVFHFKAFSLFCQQSATVNTLPWQARQMLQQQHTSNGQPQRISLADMPPGCEQACWDAFHASLEPAIDTRHMGAVVFQFQLSFTPTAANKEHVLHCRRMLRADIPMAIEFRNRSWFACEEALQKLVAWCTDNRLYLIAADELKHETYQKNNDQHGLPAGEVKQILPMSLAVTLPDFLLIRLHRRHGTTERLLPLEEHQAWSERLKTVASQLTGPIYFLWGTDWDDAPVVNAKTLAKCLPADLQYDYAAQVAKAAAAQPGSIANMFARAASASGQKRTAVSAGLVQEVDEQQQGVTLPTTSQQPGEPSSFGSVVARTAETSAAGQKRKQPVQPQPRGQLGIQHFFKNEKPG